jgi:hypothetical protein
MCICKFIQQEIQESYTKITHTAKIWFRRKYIWMLTYIRVDSNRLHNPCIIMDYVLILHAYNDILI